MFPNSSLSYTGLPVTKRFENCKFVAYPDSGGVWTIGYGHTHNVKQGDTCNQQQADRWLIQDMNLAESSVRISVSYPLTQDEYNALVDFVFNVGAGNFHTSTMLRLLNAGNITGAADEFEKWDKVHGVTFSGLLRRRIAEEKEFREGAD